jgi:hypothetical protein
VNDSFSYSLFLASGLSSVHPVLHHHRALRQSRPRLCDETCLAIPGKKFARFAFMACRTLRACSRLRRQVVEFRFPDESQLLPRPSPVNKATHRLRRHLHDVYRHRVCRRIFVQPPDAVTGQRRVPRRVLDVTVR